MSIEKNGRNILLSEFLEKIGGALWLTIDPGLQCHSSLSLCIDPNQIKYSLWRVLRMKFLFAIFLVGFLMLHSQSFADGADALERFEKARSHIKKSGKALDSFDGGIIDSDTECKITAMVTPSEKSGFQFYIVRFIARKIEKQVNVQVKHDDGFPSMEDFEIFLRDGRSKRGLQLVEIRIIK